MPKYVTAINPDVKTETQFSTSYPLFKKDAAPIPGCIAMHLVFHTDTYPEPGVHDDNEGFYVTSGNGMIKIGDEEYPISSGSAIYVPAGVKHAIKSDGGDLGIFAYHFPV